MFLRNLHLQSYRNINETEIEFSPGLNIFIGDNGQGKTNILESIYYVSTSKSHRNVDDFQLIQYEKEFSTIDCVVNYADSINSFSAIIHRKGKTLCINHNPAKKVSEFVGKVNAIIFSPLDMYLFDSSPSVRRRVMDVELGKISKIYINYLNVYNHLLKTKNTYLKQGIGDNNLLEAINEQMIQPETEIIKQRYNLIKKINERIKNIYQSLSKSSDLISIEYNSTVPYQVDDELIKQALVSKQKANEERDILSKQTNTGIHREDITFYINKKSITECASQGQKRMVIIALKLSLISIIEERTGETPILLLDDVLSELDDSKKNSLINILPSRVQTIITATDKNSIDKELLSKASIYRIEKGHVEKWMI